MERVVILRSTTIELLIVMLLKVIALRLSISWGSINWSVEDGVIGAVVRIASNVGSLFTGFRTRVDLGGILFGYRWELRGCSLHTSHIQIALQSFLVF